MNNRLNNKKNKKQKGMLLGVGLDNKDGHTRITKGEQFCLLGGSAETHEKMTETAIKFTEKVSNKGKQLHELSKEEFIDLLMEASS